MQRTTFRINGGLTAEDLKLLHQKVLCLLEKVGVTVCQHIADIVSSYEGFDLTDDRLRIRPDSVEAYLQRARRYSVKRSEATDDFTVLCPGALAFYFEDIKTAKLRPLSTDDAIYCCKLADSLYPEGARRQAAGLPQDVPVEIRTVTACKIGLENCRSSNEVGTTSPEVHRIVCDMLNAVGKRIEMLEVFVLNPMRIEGDEVEMGLQYVSKNPATPVYVHSMPIAGVSVPLHFSGALVEAAAAVIAGAAIFDLITDAPVVFDISTLFPFDMKTGSIAYGTPQHILSFLAGKQINAFYGMENYYITSLLCNASHCDAQANSLRAMQTICGALSGYHCFGFGGLLGVDKVFSPYQLLADLEITGYARDVISGFDFSERNMAIEAIAEVGPDGDFLTHSSTLKNIRHLSWHPIFFENYDAERFMNEPDRLKAKASAIVEEKVARHDFCLPKDQQNDLDAIYKRAKRTLLK